MAARKYAKDTKAVRDAKRRAIEKNLITLKEREAGNLLRYYLRS